MRLAVISALTLALAACTSNAPQVSDASASVIPTKTARYCNPARSTGSHIPTCHSRAVLVDPEALEDMTNNAAGINRRGR